jgi:hypothetical protein
MTLLPPCLHRVELCLLIRRQHRPNPRLLALVQRHHLRSPILRRQRRIRPNRFHLPTRLRKDLPYLRRLAVIQIQVALHHRYALLGIHATVSALHLPVRRRPLLLLIRRRWRRRLLLRYRRAQTQPGTTQHHYCCTKHPAFSKVLHRLFPALSLEASRLELAALLSPSTDAISHKMFCCLFDILSLKLSQNQRVLTHPSRSILLLHAPFCLSSHKDLLCLC